LSLLPNIPIGGDQIVADLMTYLAATSQIAKIQEAVVLNNQEIDDMQANISPAPAAAGNGWMLITDGTGATSIVPQWLIAESVANIQNKLLPPTGTGKSFTATFHASKQSSSQVQVSASGGISASGSILDLIGIHAQAGASYDLYSIDSSVTAVDVTLTFNGVTTVTPQPASYSVSNATGWWNPKPIQDAANAVAGDSGFTFTPTPSYDFATNGDFGTPSRLLISQQPVMELTFYTQNYAAFSQVFTQQFRCDVSFLGIPLADGSQSYYSATAKQSTNGQSVTVTMTPEGIKTPVTPNDQLAYVVGVEMDWPGAV
jgi:hypothetical protein